MTSYTTVIDNWI